jgi:hypothetical protein
MGLFDACFAPLLSGGRFFLLASILGMSSKIPLPFVDFYI